MGTLSPQFGSLIPSQTQQLLATNYLQFTICTNFTPCCCNDKTECDQQQNNKQNER